MSMSAALLVGLAGDAALYRANTQEKDAGGNPVIRFETWADSDGVDLYWMGRPVDRVYTMGKSTEVWYRVDIPAAVRSLINQGACFVIPYEPSPEGRLPVQEEGGAK